MNHRNGNVLPITSIVAMSVVLANIVVPTVFGLLRFKGLQIFTFPWGFAVGLMVTSIVLVSCYLVWSISSASARADREREKAQELVAKEKTFRDLLESAPDAMVVFNQQGNIVLTNSQLQNLFGYKKEELIRLPVETLIPDIFKLAHAGNRESFLANLRTQPNERRLELYAKRQDESRFPVEISLGLLDTEEEIIVCSVIRDFTERKQLEEDLRKQKELFQIVLSNLSDGVMVADKEGKFIVVNDAAQKMTGHRDVYTPIDKWSETFGCYLPDTVTFYPPKDLPLVKAINGETVSDVVIFLRNKFIPQGVWLSINARPMEIGGAKVGVITLRDVTMRKEAERRVSEFYSMVSHELRTPLTSINGILSLMEGRRLGVLPERASHLSHIAHMEAERLIRLINDILDVRKIEAGKLDLKFENFSPVDLINSTVQSMKGLAAESNIELFVETTTAEAIMCDRDRIVQVLTNLISNAIKFSPANSQIIVRAENGESDFVRFSVTDKGPGIAPEHMSKLFLLFQQIDSSDSRPKGGTGLGLAICKAITEQHGGKIGVDSVLNAGSTFWFELPCKQLSLLNCN